MDFTCSDLITPEHLIHVDGSFPDYTLKISCNWRHQVHHGQHFIHWRNAALVHWRVFWGISKHTESIKMSLSIRLTLFFKNYLQVYWNHLFWPVFYKVMLNYNFISGSWSYISAFMKVSQWKKCIWKKYQADFIPGICLLESVLTEMSPVQHTSSTLGWLAMLRNNYIPVRHILCTCTAEKCRLEKHRETFEEKHLAVKRSPTADDFKLKYNTMYLCRSHPWPLLMYFSQKVIFWRQDLFESSIFELRGMDGMNRE